MKTIDRTKPVLVTGGTGYLASWIVKQLLDQGFEVRTTVRNLAQKDKYAHLTALAVKSTGVLQFFEADLLKKGSFTEAMAGCELVIHTASPFKISGIKNAQKELIEPALEGTRNVLDTVNASESIKRVVLTSSVAAIFGDAIDIQKTENGTFTEALIGFSRKYVKLNVGYDLRTDNSYIKKDLGMEFLPFEQTISDHFKQLLADGIIKKP